MSVNRPFVSCLAGLATALSGCASLRSPRFVEDPARIANVASGAAGPTVVFQSGLGDNPRVGGNRDPCTVARELHGVRQAANMAPPYLLVSHSLGGIYQYAFAKHYPDEEGGLCLVDATDLVHWHNLQQRMPAAAAMNKALRTTVFTGAARDELDSQTICLDQLRLWSLPRVPLQLTVRTRYELSELGGVQKPVEDEQQQWLTLLRGLARIPVPDSGHYIQKDHAMVVEQRIHLMLKRVAAAM